MLIPFGGRVKWAIFECRTGDFRIAEKLPFLFGSGPEADWRLAGEGVAGEHCLLAEIGGAVHLVRFDPLVTMLVNGEEEKDFELKSDAETSLKIGEHLFICIGTRNPDAWRQQIDPRRWILFDENDNSVYGPVFWEGVPALLEVGGFDVRNLILSPHGAKVGFPLTSVFNVEYTIPESAVEEIEAAPPVVAVPAVGLAVDRGELTCPTCWLRFDRGDAMHIAVHESLRGDPILGPDSFQRFSATRFNDRGHALDALGMPCTDLACPHCRRRLPLGFLEIPHLIFSIVGMPQAGKSYYLSVLIKRLQEVLFQRFGTSFRDADPEGNALLNQMKSRLFSASTPEEAALAKTQLEGEMYERLPRFGREVMLPRPFIFALSPESRHNKRFSVIFYDNAGEHFEPTRDSAASPGAQHVASASAIIFLFDPLVNIDFRRRLTEHHDPQLAIKKYKDQQDVILAEMEVRVKRIMGLAAGDRINTPMAFVVGKCDAWLHLDGCAKWESPVRERGIDMGSIKRNSARLRQFLMDLCPALIANAEAISSNVEYFPVSSLGHSPVPLRIVGPDSPGVADPIDVGGLVSGEGNGAVPLGPVPERMNPMFVEVPVLWALSQIRPDIVPPLDT